MRSFVHELSERHVIKVGIAYLAIAWLLLQLAGEIGPILDAPQWFYEVLLGLLTAGFVVTLILSWIYEFTNKGIRRASDIEADASLHSLGGRQLDFIVIGALAVALGYFIWESRFAENDSGLNTIESVAVLPFSDMSADQDQAYFADGMAEELLTALSRIPNLQVSGRTSSFAFRGEQRDLQNIAAKLGVTHILEGSIRTSGDNLRVTAQLIKGEDGFQVWAREFEGNLADIFAVQDEISDLVVSSLKLQMSGAVAVAPTANTNAAAYSAYLLGRYNLAQRTNRSILTAIEQFRMAISLDNAYSPAYSGLAKTLAVSPYYDVAIGTSADVTAEASSAAEMAIALDPSNSEAYATLGLIRLIFARDWPGAEEMLLNATNMHPNDAGNANLYGDFLYTVGDYIGARKIEGLAARLEPLSAAHQHELALVYAFLGDFDNAISQERLATKLNPEFRNAWASLGTFLMQSGQHDEVQSMLESAADLMGDFSAARLAIRFELAKGNRESAVAAGLALLQGPIAELGGYTHLAHIAALIGDDETAAKWFELAYSEDDPIVVSPLYFFLPEDWPDMPKLHRAMDKPDLGRLFERRRAHIADGTGRASTIASAKELYDLDHRLGVKATVAQQLLL